MAASSENKVGYQHLPDKPLPYIEVPVVARSQVVAPRAPRCVLKSTCGCCSVGTGVRVAAVMDMLMGAMGLLACVFLMVARTHEHALDRHVEHVLEDHWGNSTNATIRIAETIASMNDHLNHAAHILPLLVVCAAISFFFGAVGWRAANGSVKDAFYFMIWKNTKAVASLFCGSFFGIIISIYVALLCRSHWIALTADVLPLRATVVVLDNANKPAKTATAAETSA